MADEKHIHSIQFEPHANGREIRVRCTKCQANAIFHAEEQPPVSVKDDDGKWTLQPSSEPFAFRKDGKEDGEWMANAADIDRWLGTECPIADEAAAEALANDLTNPKPPIVLSH